MPQNPIPANEIQRLASLATYNILDTDNEQEFDDITRLASEICQTPVSLITLLDEKRQWFKSKQGTTVAETPKENAFCVHAVNANQDIFVVKDASQDERFAGNPLVKGEANVMFYAGVPLVNDEGYALGTLCVVDHVTRELSDWQISSLKMLSKQVMARLELRRKLIELEDANKRLLESNTFIQKFAATVAHDIKNPLSSMLISAKALKQRLEKLDDAGSAKLIDINIDSGNKLLRLLDEMLEYSRSPATLLQNRQELQLNPMIREVIRMIELPEHVSVNLPENPFSFMGSHVAMQQIFLNLLTNAIRYNDKEEVRIEVGYTDREEDFTISIRDNGLGIDPKHHDLIFGNNVTMHRSDRFNKKGTGIGLATVKSLIQHMQGDIRLESVQGSGTTFYITLPKR